eukprot:4030438-Amphidinium_carterae.1
MKKRENAQALSSFIARHGGGEKVQRALGAQCYEVLLDSYDAKRAGLPKWVAILVCMAVASGWLLKALSTEKYWGWIPGAQYLEALECYFKLHLVYWREAANLTQLAKLAGVPLVLTTVQEQQSAITSMLACCHPLQQQLFPSGYNNRDFQGAKGH